MRAAAIWLAMALVPLAVAALLLFVGNRVAHMPQGSATEMDAGIR